VSDFRFTASNTSRPRSQNQTSIAMRSRPSTAAKLSCLSIHVSSRSSAAGASHRARRARQHRSRARCARRPLQRGCRGCRGAGIRELVPRLRHIRVHAPRGGEGRLHSAAAVGFRLCVHGWRETVRSGAVEGAAAECVVCVWWLHRRALPGARRRDRGGDKDAPGLINLGFIRV
jgi:hypothetical protein